MLALHEAVTIRLSGEPIGKGRPRFAGAGRPPFTPAHTRKYEDALRLSAQIAMGERAPLEGPLHVRVVAQFPIPESWSAKKRRMAAEDLIRPTKRPDVDNVLKMLDALNQVVWRDDAQIVEATIAKRYSDRPSLTIEVFPFSPLFIPPAPPGAIPLQEGVLQ